MSFVAHKGAELVVLQELHNTPYFCQTENVNNFDLAETIPGPSTLFYSELAAANHIVLVTSLFEKRATGLYHNTAVVFDKDGSIAGTYRKMHIPDDPGFYEKFYFTPGDLGFEPIQTSIGKLTFDCGYENGNTESLLDALKKHNAPASFFIVGTFLRDNPELVKRMTEEGHIVGNHTWHHPDMSSICTESSFLEELESVETLFQETTGQKMVPYYRPPQGKFSRENLKMAKELGYYTFFWSLAYVDWYENDQPTREEAFEKLLKRIHPGAIVLLHNTSSTNAMIMDELLSKWVEAGYRFAPLSELVEKQLQ